MTMLEKVEAALVEEIARQVGATPIVYKTPTKNGELNLGSLARAAITAMREPTDEMVQAAARGVSDSFHEEGFREGDDPALWDEFVKAGERAFKNSVGVALTEK